MLGNLHFEILTIQKNHKKALEGDKFNSIKGKIP
jgi:hypothetical protein